MRPRFYDELLRLYANREPLRVYYYLKPNVSVVVEQYIGMSHQEIMTSLLFLKLAADSFWPVEIL